MHHTFRRRDWLIPGVTLLALVGSLLACIKPRAKPDKPPAPATSRPDPSSQDASPEPAAAKELGQLNEVALSDTERLCEQGQASACVAAGRQAIARAEQDPSQSPRAAMFMYLACDLGMSEACYSYALMVWQRSGVAYNPEEIRFAFELARRQGSPHATIPYEGLLDPTRAEASLGRDTLYHYNQACQLGLSSACVVFAARHDGSPLPTPSPQRPQPATPQPAAPQPAAPQPSMPQPATPSSPSPGPSPDPEGPRPMIADRGLSVSGALSEESVRRTLSPRRSQLIYCYEKEQRQQPSLRGELVARVEIDARGLVVSTQLTDSTLPSPEALRCMDKLIKMWRFEPSGSGPTVLTYRALLDASMTAAP